MGQIIRATLRHTVRKRGRRLGVALLSLYTTKNMKAKGTKKDPLLYGCATCKYEARKENKRPCKTCGGELSLNYCPKEIIQIKGK